MPERPPLTVVVPCRDRPELLADCLARLRAAVGDADEVVVVDSASAGPRVAAVAHAAGARVVRCEQPGTAHARNAGWRAATHRLVAFTDDDTLVDPGWADALAAMLLEPGTGFAVGRTATPPAHAPAGDPASVTRVPPPAVITFGTPGGYGAANNLAAPADVLDEVGGFDERLGPGTWFAAGEDVELLDRILATGRCGRYAADAGAVHVQWRTPRQLRRLQWSYGKGNGARLAALARRDPATAWRLRAELLRLSGLRTAGRRLRPAPAAGQPRSTLAGVDDVSGWRGPLLRRLGSVLGFAVGLVVLGPRGRAATAPA